jgi:outer membrane receptor protein involved in Fe transport
MLVRGRGDSLLEVARSASEGTVGYQQLDLRPIARTGEVLESVPGVIVTQHAGGGKANQYFLRGFNLDHGTDFLTRIEGMPVNLPSHGHGQGYTDINIVIPELIERVNYQKGVYAADVGDFGSAGAVQLETFRVLPQSIAVLEGGMYGYGRAVYAASPRLGSGHLLYGVEAFHHDGPWDNPDDYQKFNGQLTYSVGDAERGASVTFRGYHGKWDSSDQVAESAVAEGVVPIFGSLDDTTGGDSQRYSLQAEWHRADAESATRIEAYGFYYDLDLFSNFTYFLTDQVRGDQFQQTDRRWVGGLQASHTLHGQWGGREVETTFGTQIRSDAIENGLYQTERRRRTDKINTEDGSLVPATTREDDIHQTSAGVHLQNQVRWTPKLRTVAGVRADLYHFDVESLRPENSGDRTDAIASPKLGVVAGPWAGTEVYAQGGLGFHSNDARGAVTRVDPVTGSDVDADGNPIRRADPLVPTVGAEFGIRTVAVPGLQSTVSFWWLDIDSELLFVGDAGLTEASRPSRRYGVEWANYYTLARDLTLDLDVSFSHARFRDDDPAGDRIPGSIESVVATGISYHPARGLFASIRLRYFGPRPLIEDDSFRSDETILLGAQVGYRFNRTWTLSADVVNVLDRRDDDITYAYESRVRPGGPVVLQRHFHPVEPIQARVALTARF